MYDIFISFKNTDEKGLPTRDAVIAAQLYNLLLNSDYKVFYANKSLEIEGSSAFKNEIDNALDTAKVLIVVLTNGEYASSRWVQYEWDSFYNDYLSGIKTDVHIFTLTYDVDTSALPRTLRSVQNFSGDDGIVHLLNYLEKIFRKPVCKYRVKDQREITHNDIKQATMLDNIVYEEKYLIDSDVCWKWFELNPDIYTIVEEIETHKIVAYINASPITDECYDMIKSCNYITTNITEDMILDYEMPCFYNLYFFSIVIAPECQNTEIFSMMINSLVDKFLQLSKREVYIKRMIADAVTPKGRKFCHLFGMKKIDESTHGSTLYEINMIPPVFKPVSTKVGKLRDLYQKIYVDNKEILET
ncbi:MAG: toll/interleukin-1 receptor domain-containing protein [Prevotella sp.]|nr:toll/interleukin-1 receptor domain-containing protein [Prevotella sp.]